jgi:hypothetical protein
MDVERTYICIVECRNINLRTSKVQLACQLILNIEKDRSTILPENTNNVMKRKLIVSD